MRTYTRACVEGGGSSLDILDGEGECEEVGESDPGGDEDGEEEPPPGRLVRALGLLRHVRTGVVP